MFVTPITWVISSWPWRGPCPVVSTAWGCRVGGGGQSWGLALPLAEGAPTLANVPDGSLSKPSEGSGLEDSEGQERMGVWEGAVVPVPWRARHADATSTFCHVPVRGGRFPHPREKGSNLGKKVHLGGLGGKQGRRCVGS